MVAMASLAASVSNSGPAGPRPTTTTLAIPPPGPGSPSAPLAARCGRAGRDGETGVGLCARRRLGLDHLGHVGTLVKAAVLRVHLHLCLLQGVGDPLLQRLAL